MVLEGLKVLTGTVSDLCLSGCELPRVLLKTSGPVVHVCLCIVQLTFGISVLQFSGDNLPNEARHLMLHKTLTPQAYTCVGLSVYPCTWDMLKKKNKNTNLRNYQVHGGLNFRNHVHCLTESHNCEKQQTTEKGNLISWSETLNSIFPYQPCHANSSWCSYCMCFWRGER